MGQWVKTKRKTVNTSAMKKRSRRLLVVISVLLVGAGAVLLVKNKKAELKETPAFSDRPRAVTATTAETGELSVTREFLADVEPFETARLSARVTANVTSVVVDEGDRVEIGDILLELDAEEIEHRIAVVEARIQEAEAELAGNRATVGALVESNEYWQAEKQRDRKLAADGSIPETQAEQTAEKAAEVKGRLEAARWKSQSIRSRIEALKKQRAELQTRRGYYTITSPGTGTVTRRMVDPGDQAAPGKTLVEVEDRRRLKLAFDVPQQDLPEIRQGLDVNFKVNGESRSAEISLLYPALNQAKMLRAEVWLASDSEPLPSTGSYMPIRVVIKRINEGVLLPASALIESTGGAYHVFEIEEGRLAARRVERLGRANDTVAIKGISEGACVVQNTYLGWATLSSGEKVEAIE